REAEARRHLVAKSEPEIGATFVITRNQLAFCSYPGVDRDAVARHPGVLDEHADIAAGDIAVGAVLSDRVITVLTSERLAVRRVVGSVPLQRNIRRGCAEQDVVPDPLGVPPRFE